jgi:hypothetical protein
LDLSQAQNLTSIGRSAFVWCKEVIGEIVIPASVEVIKKTAFSQMHKITMITIYGNDHRFNDRVFEGCSFVVNLNFIDCIITSITLGTGVFNNWATVGIVESTNGSSSVDVLAFLKDGGLPTNWESNQ